VALTDVHDTEDVPPFRVARDIPKGRTLQTNLQLVRKVTSGRSEPSARQITSYPAGIATSPCAKAFCSAESAIGTGYLPPFDFVGPSRSPFNRPTISGSERSKGFGSVMVWCERRSTRLTNDQENAVKIDVFLGNVTAQFFSAAAFSLVLTEYSLILRSRRP
jgi:hypothetical protein